MTEDMTLAEFVEAKRALEKEIGPGADVFVRVGGHYTKALLSASVYPDSIGGRSRDLGSVEADTLRDLLDAVRARWEERRSELAVKTINDMALAIIRLTHEHGSCTDAALRQEFNTETVTRYGDAAVVRASTMAAGGPFRIVALAGANAA